MNEKLLELFSQIINVSDRLKEYLIENLECKKFDRRAFLLKEGEISNKIFFIDTGFVRSFQNNDGKEITSWFMKEGDIIISVRSFYSNLPSTEYIQAIEPTTVHYITKDKLSFIYANFIEFNIVGRVLTEQYYMQSEERSFFLRSKSTSERFSYLLNSHPSIFLRAPLKYIASYLGMSEENLSRLRAMNS